MENGKKGSRAPVSRVLSRNCWQRGACHLSTPHVTMRLKHSTLRRNLRFGRAALRRRFTRTCSPQMARPADHPTAGGLLHRLLTLTRRCRRAVVFFCHILPSPTASIFGSGVPCAARTFLPHPSGAGDRPEHCFPSTKVHQFSGTAK